MTLPSIIDTHSHLSDGSFQKDLPQVLERASKAGVKAIISVTETFEEAQATLTLSSRFAQVLPAIGLYPTELDLEGAERVRDLIRTHHPRVVGIGEVGLDYWKVKEEEARQIQREIFSSFIRLSNELGLPLNVHSRSAGRDAIAMLLDAGASKVQMHAFDGKAQTAMKGVEAGYYFSIPPSLIRSRQKQKLVKRLPLTHLLIETDSPVLGPDPNQRNEPANAVIVVQAIAQIKEITPEEVAEVTYANTISLYGLENPSPISPHTHFG